MRPGDRAFAGLILSLHQAQWRSAHADWDISSRPDVLATLYQIGFHKSKPHSARKAIRSDGEPESRASPHAVVPGSLLALAEDGWLHQHPRVRIECHIGRFGVGANSEVPVATREFDRLDTRRGRS